MQAALSISAALSRAAGAAQAPPPVRPLATRSLAGRRSAGAGCSALQEYTRLAPAARVLQGLYACAALYYGIVVACLFPHCMGSELPSGDVVALSSGAQAGGAWSVLPRPGPSGSHCWQQQGRVWLGAGPVTPVPPSQWKDRRQGCGCCSGCKVRARREPPRGSAAGGRRAGRGGRAGGRFEQAPPLHRRYKGVLC